jgi:hypothetical protein
MTKPVSKATALKWFLCFAGINFGVGFFFGRAYANTDGLIAILTGALAAVATTYVMLRVLLILMGTGRDE